MMTEVRSLAAFKANKEDDNSLWSPAECLEDTLRDIRSGELKCDKLMILCLDTSDNAYNIRRRMCDLKSSEQVALLEIAKVGPLRDIGLS